MDEITKQNKLLLEHSVLKDVAAFLKENPDVYHLTLFVQTIHPQMTLTEDGKCHTGRVVLIDDKAMSEEEYFNVDDGYPDDDDKE